MSKINLHKYLYKNVVVTLKSGNTYHGFVDMMENSLDTEDGYDAIVLVSDEKGDVWISEHEIKSITEKELSE